MRNKRKWLGKACALKECDRPAHCRGLCITHYTYLSQGRDFAPLGTLTRRKHVKDPHAKCPVEGCEAPQYSGGLCHTHVKARLYSRRGGDNQCTVPGCDLQHLARGYCTVHYAAWRLNHDAFLATTALGEPEEAA